MKYWITTHWPPYDKLNGPDPFYYGVWVQDGLEHVAGDIRPGDLVHRFRINRAFSATQEMHHYFGNAVLVFKYESRTGRSRNEPQPDGSIVTQKCQRGHMGIVAIMLVTSALQDENNPTTNYNDGSKACWRYHATAVEHDTKGFVSLSKLNAILGFGSKNRMRGFGTAHSGLKEIDKATYDRIYTVFKSGTPVA